MTEKPFGRFKLHEIAQSFPESADSMLLDVYLTDEPAASTRVFRVYRSTPPHFHRGSDEHLYVLSGTGTFWMEDSANTLEFAPGICCFSSAEPSMPCRRSTPARWSSSRSTPLVATRKILSL